MLDRQACWVFTGECLPALQMQKTQSQAPDPFLFHPAPCLPTSLLWSASPYTGYCPSPTPWIIFTKVSVCPDLPRVVQHMCTALVKWLIVSPCTQNCSGLGNKLNHHSSPLWASLVAQLVKNLPVMLEIWVQSRGWEDPLEKGKASITPPVFWLREFHGQSRRFLIQEF